MLKIIKVPVRWLYQIIFIWPIRLTPKFVLQRAAYERLSIDRFINDYVLPKMKPEYRLLDAGAGPLRYKHLFVSRCKFESTDFADIFDKSSKNRHDFTCSLDDIPKPEHSYDVVLNTQVLEHVEFPQKVVNELHRILKPGGQLFMTTPQSWGLHGAPYNFYFFTRFGLESMFKQAGFRVVMIEPRGGFFAMLGGMLAFMPAYIFNQHFFGGYKRDIYFKDTFKPTVTGFLLLPFYVLTRYLFEVVVPFIFYYVDPLDKQKYFTLGYSCHCIRD